MFKPLMTLSVALGCSVAAQALDLIIPAGGEYQIEQGVLVLDRLRLGEGAKLTLAPDITQLNLTAEQVWLEQGAILDFSGRNGAKGESPLAMAKQTHYCKPGAQGAPGHKGADGASAPQVHLNFKFERVEASQIMLKGGNGGAGGNGAQGQAGGDAYQCRGGDGGQGGHGGEGGNGGNGGKLWFHYQAPAGVNVTKLVKISLEPGLGGAAGLAGVGGAGGEGRYAKMGGRNAKKWLAGGAAGAQGESASVGKPGLNGQLLLEQERIHIPAVKQLAAQGEVKTLELLMQRIHQLELRVDALEKAKK